MNSKFGGFLIGVLLMTATGMVQAEVCTGTLVDSNRASLRGEYRVNIQYGSDLGSFRFVNTDHQVYSYQLRCVTAQGGPMACVEVSNRPEKYYFDLLAPNTLAVSIVDSTNTAIEDVGSLECI